MELLEQRNKRDEQIPGDSRLYGVTFDEQGRQMSG
jgi:hypothetical protein